MAQYSVITACNQVNPPPDMPISTGEIPAVGVRWESSISMHEFSVLVHRAEDMPGQWISHCLNLGLVSVGDSPTHAFEMIVEAVCMVIEDDIEDGRDIFDRKPAPQQLWDVYGRIRTNGDRLEQKADINQIAEAQSISAIAATLFLEWNHAQPGVTQQLHPGRLTQPPHSPMPAYLCAEFLRENNEVYV